MKFILWSTDSDVISHPGVLSKKNRDLVGGLYTYEYIEVTTIFPSFLTEKGVVRTVRFRSHLSPNNLTFFNNEVSATLRFIDNDKRAPFILVGAQKETLPFNNKNPKTYIHHTNLKCTEGFDTCYSQGSLAKRKNCSKKKVLTITWRTFFHPSFWRIQWNPQRCVNSALVPQCLHLTSAVSHSKWHFA